MKTWHQVVSWCPEPLFVIIFTVWLGCQLNLHKKKVVILFYIVFILLPLTGTGKIKNEATIYLPKSIQQNWEIIFPSITFPFFYFNVCEMEKRSKKEDSSFNSFCASQPTLQTEITRKCVAAFYLRASSCTLQRSGGRTK